MLVRALLQGSDEEIRHLLCSVEHRPAYVNGWRLHPPGCAPAMAVVSPRPWVPRQGFPYTATRDFLLYFPPGTRASDLRVHTWMVGAMTQEKRNANPPSVSGGILSSLTSLGGRTGHRGSREARESLVSFSAISRLHPQTYGCFSGMCTP